MKDNNETKCYDTIRIHTQYDISLLSRDFALYTQIMGTETFYDRRQATIFN